MKKSQASLMRRPAKWDIVYSREIETPHVKWADPYVKGPVRAFFLSSVHEGRSVIELMQRLSLTGRAVSIDPRWDVNKWCINRYAAFDRIHPRDYSQAFTVAEEELATNARYDVLVMHSVRGWNEFPANLKKIIYARVRRGEGLVLVHPHLGEDQRDKGLWDLSPIIGVPPTTLKGAGAGIDTGYPRPPKEAMSGARWQKAADHFIVNGIPLEALPYPALEHYRYRLARGAKALVTGARGKPVVAVKQYGEGRVVGLGYHNYALFPQLKTRRGELNENFWEYLFSLLMRSIIWAARKEPAVQLHTIAPSAARFAATQRGAGNVTLHVANAGPAKQVQVSATFCDENREVEGQVTRRVRLPRGETEVSLPLPKGAPAGGRHFADVILSAGGKKYDWGTATYQVSRPARVARVMLDADAVAAGGKLTGRARLAGKPQGMTLVAELWDQSGRLLCRESIAVGEREEVKFGLSCPEALTNIGWVKCRLLEGNRLVDERRAEVALTAPRRKWEDYEVIVPWLHDGVWPWTDLIEQQYRQAGVTSTSIAGYNFSLTVSLETPGYGVYWYRRYPYLEQKANYAKTKDTRYLARVPCFHTDQFRRPVAAALRKRLPAVLKYSPLACYLADESSITCYEDAFDLCWSKATLAEFRKWLEKHYQTLEALNAEWGTEYQSWEAVMPATWEQAQRRGNPAPWVDHRLFMNRAFADTLGYAVQVVKEIDPNALATISGTQLPGSHNGCNWWQVDQIIDYLQPYSGGGQDEMHASFNANLILTGFTGYTLSGIPLEYEIWHRFFHGHRGASIFWGYTFVDPDLTMNAQGRSFVKTFGELRREGLCRTVTGLKREHDKIAIHFSMASGHVWWIQDGWLRYRELEYGTASSPNFARFVRSRVGWGQVMEDIGYQYRYLSYEQLEKGELTAGGYRVLILPGSIALSDREVEQIRAFVKAGGLLVADVRPGVTDEHGKRRPQGALDDLFAGRGCGKGRAVCPNQWADRYPNVRLDREGQGIRAMLLEELRRAKVVPHARVARKDGRHPIGVERVSWQGDGIEVLGLLKETRGAFRESSDGTMDFVVREGMKEVDAVKIDLPKEGHWYDLRAHRYLGKVSEISTELREADPKLYGILPYRVAGLSMSVKGGRKPGAAVTYEAKVDTGSAKPAGHVVKIEVFGPDGKERGAYSRNIGAPEGTGVGEFRLALNDPKGQWRLVASDVFSGAAAEKTWKVS